MELFKKETHINFMGHRKIIGLLSVMVCVLAITAISIYGLNFGLEFTGGTQVELRFSKEVQLSDIRSQLEKIGLKDVKVQYFGSTKDILIRVRSAQVSNEEKIRGLLKSAFMDEGRTVEFRSLEYIGSEVGNQLAEQGGMAVLVAIIATMIYIALRFEYRFAISAAVALCHDALFVLGVFSFFQVEFDLATLAAILAILGYSLNDTIVVFDRVRENFRKIRKGSTTNIMNISVNQTLARTIMTSLLTLVVVLALLFFGGESLFGFSLALSLGIVVGTYSSIYVAGGFALTMGLSRADLLPKPKAEIDGLP